MTVKNSAGGEPPHVSLVTIGDAYFALESALLGTVIANGRVQLRYLPLHELGFILSSHVENTLVERSTFLNDGETWSLSANLEGLLLFTVMFLEYVRQLDLEDLARTDLRVHRRFDELRASWPSEFADEFPRRLEARLRGKAGWGWRMAFAKLLFVRAAEQSLFESSLPQIYDRTIELDRHTLSMVLRDLESRCREIRTAQLHPGHAIVALQLALVQYAQRLASGRRLAMERSSYPVQ